MSRTRRFSPYLLLPIMIILTSSPLDWFKCIQLFRCKTGMVDCAYMPDDCFIVVVQKITLRYTNLFELLEKPQTLRCLGCYYFARGNGCEVL